MKTTIELLNAVVGGNSDRSLAAHLHISPTTISMARRQNRVSPTLARRLARELTMQEPEAAQQAAMKHWVHVAVAEQLPLDERVEMLEAVGVSIDPTGELWAQGRAEKARTAAQRLASNAAANGLYIMSTD